VINGVTEQFSQRAIWVASSYWKVGEQIQVYTSSDELRVLG